MTVFICRPAKISRAGGEGYDFTALPENVAPFYKDFDINWINQETSGNGRASAFLLSLFLYARRVGAGGI